MGGADGVEGVEGPGPVPPTPLDPTAFLRRGRQPIGVSLGVIGVDAACFAAASASGDPAAILSRAWRACLAAASAVVAASTNPCAASRIFFRAAKRSNPV